MGFLRVFLKNLFGPSPKIDKEAMYSEETEEDLIWGEEDSLWEDPWDMLSDPATRPPWRDTDGDGIADCYDIAPLLQDDDDDDE
jgi:hypothetical protein